MDPRLKLVNFFEFIWRHFLVFKPLFVIQNSNCISNIGDVLQKKERTLKKDYGAFTIMWSNMFLVYFRQTVKQSDSFCESLWLKHIRSFQLAASKRVLHQRRCKYWFILNLNCFAMAWSVRKTIQKTWNNQNLFIKINTI